MIMFTYICALSAISCWIWSWMIELDPEGGDHELYRSFARLFFVATAISVIVSTIMEAT